jgi:hypothetical protein
VSRKDEREPERQHHEQRGRQSGKPRDPQSGRREVSPAIMARYSL